MSGVGHIEEKGLKEKGLPYILKRKGEVHSLAEGRGERSPGGLRQGLIYISKKGPKGKEKGALLSLTKRINLLGGDEVFIRPGGRKEK